MAHNNQEALDQLAKELGINLAFNSNKVADLLIGENEVTLAGDPEGNLLRINGIVGSLEDSQSVFALKRLLFCNFNGQGTGDYALSLDHVTEEVVLGTSVRTDHLGPGGLFAILDDFAKYLEAWSQNLHNITSETQSSSETSEESNFVRV